MISERREKREREKRRERVDRYRVRGSETDGYICVCVCGERERQGRICRRKERERNIDVKK
jgi:hypothetical protein